MARTLQAFNLLGHRPARSLRECDGERVPELPPSKRSPRPLPSHSLSDSGSDGSIYPAVWNVTFFRRKAEDLGDFAAEMIAEGLEDAAYRTSVQAFHFGRIANKLYRQRALELQDGNPEWFTPKERKELRNDLVGMIVLFVLAFGAFILAAAIF